MIKYMEYCFKLSFFLSIYLTAPDRATSPRYINSWGPFKAPRALIVAVDGVLADDTLLGVPPTIAIPLHPYQLDSIAQADSPMCCQSLASLNRFRAQVNPRILSFG